MEIASVNSRALRIAQIAGFAYLVSVIVVMASERVYWYWAGFTPDSVLFLGVFYLIPVTGALWAMAHSHATKFHHVILGGAFFAFLTEGVMTPIIYGDGPLPFLAAMFIGWHGMIAFVGFLYLTRKWLLEQKTRRLVAVSGGFGALWGVWAMAASVGDTEIAIDAVYTTTIDPAVFGLYALSVGATLAGAHWLIGCVWPRSWRPSRWSTALVAIVSIGYMSVAVITAVPWAPVKLAVLLGGTYWFMARGNQVRRQEPNVFDQLAGRVRARDAALLLATPIVAAFSYGATWSLGLHDGDLQVVFSAFTTAQIIGGVVAFIWAARQTLRVS